MLSLFGSKSSMSPKSASNTGKVDNPSIQHQFDISKKENRLTDHIEEHNGVTPFTYVSLTANDGRTKKIVMDFLAARKTESRTEVLPLGHLPVNDLVKNAEEFCMADVLKYWRPKKKEDRIRKWVSLYEMAILFGGSNSFIGKFGEVEIRLEDRRRINDWTVKKAVTMDNSFTAIYMSLEHAVFRRDLRDIFLVVERRSRIHNDGIVWGSLRLEMSLRSHDECVVGNVIPVIGFVDASPTALVKFKTNPNMINMIIQDGNLDALIQLRKKGLLMDLTRPSTDQDLNQFLGSEAGSDDRPLFNTFVEYTREKIPTNALTPKENNKIVGFVDSVNDMRRETEDNWKKQSDGDQVEGSNIGSTSTMPLSEWTKLAQVIQDYTGNLVKAKGFENSIGEFRGLKDFMKSADAMVKDLRVYIQEADGFDKGKWRINHVAFDEGDFLELTFYDLFKNHKAKIFTDE
jgi:hypothetical protein